MPSLPDIPHVDVPLPPAPVPVALPMEEPQLPRETTDSDLEELSSTLAILQDMGLLKLHHDPEPPTEVPKKVPCLDLMRQSTLEELPAVVWTPRATAGGNNEVPDTKDSVAADPTSFKELAVTRSPHKDYRVEFVLKKLFGFFSRSIYNK